MKLITLLLLATISLNLSAQSLDEELGFMYVKAEYLLEKSRYDEAITELNKIIDKDAAFKDALYKRAEAKFQVGAFQGTMKDLNQAFDTKGISPESLLLYGKAQKNLGNSTAAETTLATADMLFPSGSSPRQKAENNRTSKQETSTNDGEGDTTKDPTEIIKDQITSILEDLLPDASGNEEKTDESSTTETSGGTAGETTGTDRTNRQTKGGRAKSDTQGDAGDDKVIFTPAEIEEVVPEVDDSVNEIFVDEDVTLIIKNGLGARKILQQPNILILSETSGEVVIDICVNKNGKVTEAEYNNVESSLKTQSIISLAVRKSKEFWFKSASQDEMCGTIVFKITGS